MLVCSVNGIVLEAACFIRGVFTLRSVIELSLKVIVPLKISEPPHNKNTILCFILGCAKACLSVITEYFL